MGCVVAVVGGWLIQSAVAAEWPTLDLELVAEGLSRPVYATHAGDGSGRLFVVEQTGTIRILLDGQLLPDPFLDVSTRTAGGTGGGSEQGLLGLAFAPGFEENGRFYVYYYAPGSITRLSRFVVSDDDPNRSDAGDEQPLLTIAQPQGNHNGGQIAFGPDGYLYVAVGDGGGGNDDDSGHGAIGNGQDRGTLLGSLLRLDVESSPTETYRIPDGNPFTDDPSASDEIWAYGLRNPYRFSFDRLTGDLFIADVGQGAQEEINVTPAGAGAGWNYGWRLYEGSRCTQIQGDPCEPAGLTFPVIEYAHAGGRCSVTGGYVHRGADAWTPLHGTYLYGDYCTGEIWGLKRDESGWANQRLLDTSFRIAGFGEDQEGNLYLCHLDLAVADDGALYRVVDTTVYPDVDEDDMPAAFESFYGFDDGNPTDAAEDPDEDGLTNLDEWVVGTNPTNALSTLSFSTASVGAQGRLTLQWDSRSQRDYTVSGAPQPGEDTVPVILNRPATPPVNTISLSVTGRANRVYRLEAEWR